MNFVSKLLVLLLCCAFAGACRKPSKVSATNPIEVLAELNASNSPQAITTALGYPDLGKLEGHWASLPYVTAKKLGIDSISRRDKLIVCIGFRPLSPSTKDGLSLKRSALTPGSICICRVDGSRVNPTPPLSFLAASKGDD